MIAEDHVIQYHPCCQWIPRNTSPQCGAFDSVKINTSLIMMRECHIPWIPVNFWLTRTLFSKLWMLFTRPSISDLLEMWEWAGIKGYPPHGALISWSIAAKVRAVWAFLWTHAHAMTIMPLAQCLGHFSFLTSLIIHINVSIHLSPAYNLYKRKLSSPVWLGVKRSH